MLCGLKYFSLIFFLRYFFFFFHFLPMFLIWWDYFDASSMSIDRGFGDWFLDFDFSLRCFDLRWFSSRGEHFDHFLSFFHCYFRFDFLDWFPSFDYAGGVSSISFDFRYFHFLLCFDCRLRRLFSDTKISSFGHACFFDISFDDFLRLISAYFFSLRRGWFSFSFRLLSFSFILSMASIFIDIVRGFAADFFADSW